MTERVKNKPDKQPVQTERVKNKSDKQPVQTERVKNKPYKQPVQTAVSGSVEKSSPPQKRRSVRFKDQEKKSQTGELDKVKSTAEPVVNEDRVKDDIGNVAGQLEVEEESVVVINDSEPIEIDSQDSLSGDHIVDESQIDEQSSKVQGEATVKEACKGRAMQEIPTIPSHAKKDTDEKVVNSFSDNSGTSLDKVSSLDQVQQNLLGVVGITDSTCSSTEAKSDGSQANKESINDSDMAKCDKDNKKKDMSNGKCVNTKLKDQDLMDEIEKVSSEPLFSWTQKLNELSQSPRLCSPLKKLSSSQDSTLSPRRSKSPVKSPKRNRRKVTNENEADKGALDKWITRSPSKRVIPSEKQTEEVIVANLSLVEETQSPSKFLRSKEKADSTPSIMETPPKNVLESLTASHTNSNRKLFSSQENTSQIYTVEDSNLVPASPNSKAYTVKTGTPVVKLKKLTESDIITHSPTRKGKLDLDLTPSKSQTETKQDTSLPCLLQDKESSHEHDDFSVFKPLENDKVSEPIDDFFSEDLTSTEQAMLTLDENQFNSQQKDNLMSMNADKESCSGSEPLFSEEIHEEAVVNNSEESYQNDNKDLTVSNPDKTEDIDKLDEPESKETVSSTPGRGRKRKQVTPRKMTPEDCKRKKKQPTNERSTRRSIAKGKDKNETEKQDDTSAAESKQKQGTHKDDTQPADCLKNGKKLKKVSMEETGPRKKEKNNKNSSSTPNTKRGRKCKGSQESQEQTTDTLDVEDCKTRGVKTVNVGELGDSINKMECNTDDMTMDTSDVKTCAIDSVENDKNSGKTNLKSSVVNSSNGSVTTFKPKRKKGKPSSLEHVEVASDTEKTDLADVNDNEMTEQKTPESKTLEKRQPGRRSTTKHKKEIVQKLVNRRGKECLVNDGYLNLDSENSETIPSPTDGFARKLDENVQFTNISQEIVGSQSSTEICADKLFTGKGENDGLVSVESAEKAKDKLTSESDDDIPLLQMSKKMTKKGKRKIADIKATSPVSNKLQLSNFRKTRLRSAEKKQTSPKSKMSVALALKRSRNKTVKLKTTSMETESKSEELQDIENKPEPDVGEESKETKVEKAVSKDVVADLQDDVSESPEFDETPRKGLESAKTSVASVIMMRNSDSKLILGSRKFQKRGVIVRRSILKTVSVGSAESLSPVRVTDFHPIKVSHVYSPTASPSASILKKRRLSEDPCIETGSPPAKVILFLIYHCSKAEMGKYTELLLVRKKNCSVVCLL